jgi:hypothetical protein
MIVKYESIGLSFFADVLTPLSLSVLLFPFLFSLNALLYFERQAVSLKVQNVVANWSPSIVLEIFLVFGLSLRNFDRWQRFIRANRPRSEADLRESIWEIHRNIRDQGFWRLKYCDGPWSPVKLMRLLSPLKLGISFYDKSFDVWYGDSGSVSCKEESKINSIQFFLEGDRFCIRKAVLIMDIFETEKCEIIAMRFERAANILLNEFFSEELSLYTENFEVEEQYVKAVLKTTYRGEHFACRELTLFRI